MRFLLDTHFVIWAITDTSKIYPEIQKVLINPENEIIVSTISFWEISLKFSLGKLDLGPYFPEEFPTACINMGFEILDVKNDITSTYHQLKANYHRDPFDRLLIWEAIKNDMILVTIDENIKKYSSEGLRVLTI